MLFSLVLILIIFQLISKDLLKASLYSESNSILLVPLIGIYFISKFCVYLLYLQQFSKYNDYNFNTIVDYKNG